MLHKLNSLHREPILSSLIDPKKPWLFLNHTVKDQTNTMQGTSRYRLYKYSNKLSPHPPPQKKGNKKTDTPLIYNTTVHLIAKY